MGRSHVNRRRRERPLRHHRDAVDRELDLVCGELDVNPPPPVRRDLVDEVVRFASPWAFQGIDAVLPAERKDLIRAWLFYRLVGTVETPSDIRRMARSFAPAPDDDFRAGGFRFGDPTTAAVAGAHASRHRRHTAKSGRVMSIE